MFVKIGKNEELIRQLQVMSLNYKDLQQKKNQVNVYNFG